MSGTVELVTGEVLTWAELAHEVRLALRAMCSTEPAAPAPAGPAAPVSVASPTADLVAEVRRREAVRARVSAELRDAREARRRRRWAELSPSAKAARLAQIRARYHAQRELARLEREQARRDWRAVVASSSAPAEAVELAERAVAAHAPTDRPAGVVVRGSHDLVRWLAVAGRERVALGRDDLLPLALRVLDDRRANEVLGGPAEDRPPLGADWSSYLERLDLERLAA